MRLLREEELERVQDERDVEITLGNGMLIALGCGLFLLCAVCFWMGFSLGHRGGGEGGAGSTAAARLSPFQPQNATKPSAAVQPPATPPEKVSVDVPADENTTTADATTAGSAEAAGTQAQPRATAGDAVKPALGSQAAAGQQAQAQTGLQVQPALSQTHGWMVQIAAVSRVEDAEVLVNALKRRGYSVTVRRDISDNLLHVQTGPFVNRNDANTMRQKLTNDGYNAQVQP